MLGPLRSSIALAAVLFLALISAPGCGAKTGLLLPDVAIDVVTDAYYRDVRDVSDVTDVTADVPKVCVPGTFKLEPRHAEVMFLIDRSNSMNLTLDGMDRMPGAVDSRWRVLNSVLQRT